MTTATATDRPMTDRAREVLKRAGNPFRNYFARNPDDEVCAKYHVPELFAAERDLVHAIIDLYRYDPMTHSEVVPVLGNKGAGKTHLLHSIKHGVGGLWQLLVTPGVYQKDSDFLEYLLFQIIDTLLGGGKQKGLRPLEHIGEQLVRRQLGVALRDLSGDEKVELFPPPGLGRWARRLGLGGAQAEERAAWLAENLSGYSNFARVPTPLPQALTEAGLPPQKAFDLLCSYVQRTEAHNTAGLMRRHIYQGFAKAALLKDESELAGFLTYGFAELEFNVRPTRQDLVLALFKVLMEVFRGLKTPVVVAFDQLEDLLLARRSDDAHKTAEAFFAGIVQVMHQIDGLCFLIFAERGLWNRFVPSLDGYIQDRLNNPVHVPKHGTVKALRLEAPPEDLARRVVEARLESCLRELPRGEATSEIYPFTDDAVLRIARTEPTLRDMLQQFRHLFDHLVYGPDDVRTDTRAAASWRTGTADPLPPRQVTADGSTVVSHGPEAPRPPMPETMAGADGDSGIYVALDPIPAPESRFDASGDLPFGRPVTPMLEPPAGFDAPPDGGAGNLRSRIKALLGDLDDDEDTETRVEIKSLTTVHAPEPTNPPPLALPPADDMALGVAVDSVEPHDAVAPTGAPDEVQPPAAKGSVLTHAALVELWDQEQRAARRKLEPEGALTGATRELQAGLGAFLTLCHEHGVKVGPWRLQHVVSEWAYGDHPTYGVVTLAHWACKDGQPWKVGVGLFLARGAGKPKDLEVKLSAMNTEPAVVDHLILLRPEDDLALSGKSKTLWQDAEKRKKHARLEPIALDGFATVYSFPRWLAAVREALPEGAPLPNLADVIQEKCEKLLEQVCMPVQG